MSNRYVRKFKNNKRGYYSFIILFILFFISMFSELIANDKPLFVYFKGGFYFPVCKSYPETVFGGTLKTETDYKDEYIKELINKNGFMILPPVHYSYDTINYKLDVPSPAPPSTENILGTDDQGRDVLSRIIYGFRISILFGLCLTVLSSIIGIFIGAVQGYFGGKIDLFMQRFIEIWSSLPQLFILILVCNIFTPSFTTLLIIMLFFSWTSLVSVVRAEFLKVRKMDYVKAAKALGVNDFVIIFRHILPNAVTAALSYFPFILSGAIVSLTALDFLGLGLPAGAPSLGEILRQGKENLQAPWLGLSGFMIIAVMLCLLVFIGEAVRDAFDPRKEEK